MSEVLLAFDFGLKRIGVAVGNTMLKHAQPLTVIHAKKNTAKFDEIEALIAEWAPAYCVVGLPLHPDGNEHEMTARCRRFANQLHGRFGLDTILVDERYTSVVISSDRGEAKDDQSATLILQQYFDDDYAKK